eukprot:s5154_g3.t1
MVHLILVLAVFWLPCYARPSPKYFSSGDKAKYAACGFDVWAAVNSIGFAGLSINAASKEIALCACRSGAGSCECKGADSPLKKTVCTSAVAGTHAALADVASFLSSSASDCAKDLNNQAYCAADSSGLVSGLANIATASAAMHAVRQEADLDWWEKVFSNVRKAEIAECVFNTNMAAQLLGRMGLAIQASTQDVHVQAVIQKSRAERPIFCSAHAVNGLLGVEDCTDFNFKINGAGGQKVCAVDLAGVIGSFMGAGQFLSALASKCTGKAYPADPTSGRVAELPVFIRHSVADCTSAAFQVIGAIDTLAAVGASFPLTCGGEGEELDYKDFILP